MAKDKGTKLTPKQAVFVQEYLIDRNATQAAIRAGYSKKTANEQAARLLAKVSISEAVSKEQAKREKRTEISADYVLTGLKTVADRCMQAEPILDSEGCETGVWRFNAQGANKALELLGKHLGMFDKQNDNSELMNAILDRMAVVSGVIKNPLPQRNIEDFETK